MFSLLSLRFVLCSCNLDVLRTQRIMGFFILITHKATRSENRMTCIIFCLLRLSTLHHHCCCWSLPWKVFIQQNVSHECLPWVFWLYVPLVIYRTKRQELLGSPFWYFGFVDGYCRFKSQNRPIQSNEANKNPRLLLLTVFSTHHVVFVNLRFDANGIMTQRWRFHFHDFKNS